jgi:hypothetical protein
MLGSHQKNIDAWFMIYSFFQFQSILHVDDVSNFCTTYIWKKLYKCCVMVVCIIHFDSSYNLFDTYKCFVPVVCRICSTCIHICADSSYNLFGTYKYFVLVVSRICSDNSYNLSVRTNVLFW